MKKICFVAQFPPPIHGLSKAIETLYDSDLNSYFALEKINITNNKKFLVTMLKILTSTSDLYYLTISQSRGGNLRDLVILKLIKIKHKKCIIHLHGGHYRQLVDNNMAGWQKKANYKIIKKLTGAIVLSDSLKRNFQGMIADEKIHVVMNCVDNEYLLSDAEVLKKLKSLQTKKILHVMWLSNFIRSKGYLEVLEMAKLEKERVIDGGKMRFHFDFAGKFFEDTEKQIFENYVTKNKLEDFIKYHGIVDGQEKKELLKLCDIFILPTHYPNEGQPISILEAMGNAMFIVTTNHAGIPDIVKDGVNGIIIDKNSSINKTYEKLASIDNNTFNIICSRNRDYCKQQFSQQKYIDRMKEIFSNE